MNIEDQFVRKLEAFFDEDYNDFTKRRIALFLKEYRDEIPPVVVIEKEKKEPEIIYYNRERRQIKKPIMTIDQLHEEASIFCEENGITVKEFLLKKGRKTKGSIVQLRRIFCNLCFQKYLCTNNILAKFFNVDHSSISFYLYGKKYISKALNPRKKYEKN